MLILSSDQVRSHAPMPRLIEALRDAFREEHVVPPRQILSLPSETGERIFLAMPAFTEHGIGMTKLATVYPDNKSRGLPTIQAAIVVFSETGTPVAVLDGTTITQLRTDAASALASHYLSRSDSSHLVIIGTGALAPVMALAHTCVRQITTITICGRQPQRVAQTVLAVRALVPAAIEVLASTSIETAAATASIISCATSTSTPVLLGKWIQPGTFVDLVGSFSPKKREVDDEAVTKSRIFVDTFEGAMAEAGDLLDPLQRGVINREHIEGELADLVRGRVSGRLDNEIILFKSVGTGPGRLGSLSAHSF